MTELAVVFFVALMLTVGLFLALASWIRRRGRVLLALTISAGFFFLFVYSGVGFRMLDWLGIH